MLEPDALVYLNFATLAMHQGVFNGSITNPYLAYPRTGFFEGAGLYQLPALLHLALPSIPLIWDFRILFALAVAAIYLVTLLIAKKILDRIPINHAFKYVAYSMILMSFLLMQYNEVIEWRGDTFITALGLIIFYLVCLLFLNKEWKPLKKLLVFSGALFFLFASYYMWSGWEINLLPFLLIPIFLVYDRLKALPKFYWTLSIVIFFIAVVICVLTLQIQQLIVSILGATTAHYGYYLNCFYNPLSLSEVACLNFSNGLYTVALDMFFLAITVKVFLSDKMFSLEKKKYEYLIIGMTGLILLGMPLVLLYVRLLQAIAPYLTLAFAVGTVTLLSRMGSNRLVLVLVVLAILISSVISVLIFWQTTAILYTISNPLGLQSVTGWLNTNANRSSTVLGFYSWGDALEYSGHVLAYSDTIQQLNISRIEGEDAFYSTGNITQACSYLSNLDPHPDYVLTSAMLGNFTLFQNMSANSIVKNQFGIETCGYTLAYNANGFYVWRS